MTASAAARTAPSTRREGRPEGASPSRLTGRGRALLLLVLVVLLFGAFSLGRAATEASTGPASVAAVQTTTVQPGETLWAVAKRIAPEHDPRPVIDQIRRLNGMSGAGLQSGQQLLLPVPGA